MPIGYGSTIELPKLLSSEIGELKEKHKDLDSWVGMTRLFIALGEIGGTILFPGLGIPLAIAGSIGNQVVDSATGNTTTFGTIMNVAGAVIPIGMTGVRNFRSVARIQGQLEGIGKQVSQESFHLANAAYKPGSKLWHEAVNEGNYGQGLIKDIAKDLKPSIFTSAEKQYNTLSAYRGTKWWNPNSPGAELLSNVGKRTFNKVATGFQLANKIDKEINESVLNKANLTVLELAELEGLLLEVSGFAARRGIMYQFLQDVRGLDEARLIMKEVTNEAKEIFARLSKKYNTNTIKLQLRNQVFQKMDREELIWYKKIWKSLGSKKFNDWGVQPVQAVFDARDLGRAPMEAAYKTLKKGLKKVFKNLSDKFSIMNNMRKMEEAFEKAGGVVVNSSVILGYKVIQEVGAYKLLQISFRPNATRSKKYIYNGRPTKNYGGKKPVYVQATALDFARLHEGGMGYYLKRWALNKGGAPVGVSIFGLEVGGLAESMLAFIPVQQLRNILSITSNVVSNVSKTVRGTGGFARGWEARFQDSFKRAFINRSGRLLGRAVVGGIVGAFFGAKIGGIVGREAQRFASAVTSSGLKASKGHKGTFGQRWVAGFNRQVKTRLAESARSHMTRHARSKNRNNAVLQSRSSIRKLGFVRRIGSAVDWRPSKAELNRMKRNR